jgi:chemotaxis protein methyltransferase CheR
MTDRALQAFVALVRRRTGIVIGDDKTYLIEARLAPYAQTGGFAGVEPMLAAVLAGRDARLLDICVDAMTTNETLFFRDTTPFVALAERLAQHAAHPGSGKLRIWSAACSTGQEPYSIAMVVDEVRQRHPDLAVEIVASDLSNRCVLKAQEGCYSQFEVQRGVSMPRLLRYFEGADGRWKVTARLKSDIRWKTLNLTEPFAFLGMFDVIFCRNVLFYFEPAQRRDILERMARQMAPDGCLFLGASETLLGVTDCFDARPGMSGLRRAADPGQSRSA